MSKTNLSQAKNVNFLFTIGVLPETKYWVQDVTLPAINVGETTYEHSSIDYPVFGDKLDYDPLVISFIVDEDWNNWQEVYELIFNAANPENPRLRSDLKFDATLAILDGNKNPVLYLKFVDCVPISLEGVAFDFGAEAPESMQSTLTLRFSYMLIDRFKDIPL